MDEILMGLDKLPSVRITKQAIVENPEFPTPATEDHTVGLANPETSIPVDYTITGTLLRDVEVGESINVLRYTRNDVKVTGVMTTSPVTHIDAKNGGLEIHTRNSIYNLEWL